MITRRFFCLAAPAFIAATKLDFGVPKSLLNSDNYWARLTAVDKVERKWAITRGGVLLPRNRRRSVNEDWEWVQVVKDPNSERGYRLVGA